MGSVERREGQEKYEPNPLQNGDFDLEKESPEFILLSSEEGFRQVYPHCTLPPCCASFREPSPQQMHWHGRPSGSISRMCISILIIQLLYTLIPFRMIGIRPHHPSGAAISRAGCTESFHRFPAYPL